MTDDTEGSRNIEHGKLKEQAAQKEKEWRKLQELQIETLEASLIESRKERAEEKGRMAELKDNFKYNLRLIEERDAELQKYDAIFLELKSVILKKEHELSDCKIKIDELKVAAGRESKALEEMQLHYRQRLREKQAEVEQYRCEKDAEINAERDVLEAYKISSDRRVVELEEELDKQRREMSMSFDEMMKKREHEHRVELDKKNITILGHELKVKMLANELAVMKTAQESSASELAQVDSFQRDIEKQLRQKEWEFEDLKAMSTARIVELEGKLQQCELVAKRNRDDFERRFAEADRVVREKEAALVNVREFAKERENHFVAENQALSSKLEDASVRLRQLEWNVQDLEKEKSNMKAKLEEEILDIKLRWEADLAEVSRINVSRELELNALKDNESKLRSELEQRRHDIERYKKDLGSAIERQASLEQSKAQLELDWQQRCKDLERSLFARSEYLVQTLMKARDEALAQVHVYEAKVEQKEDLLKRLVTERDQALATLSKHGLGTEREIKVAVAGQSGEIVSLQKQNEELRHVVKQMRREMELLSDQLPNAVNTHQEKDGAVTRDGTAENKQKVGRIEKLPRQQVDKGDSQLSSNQEHNLSKDSVIISSHIQQLNDTIGVMRTEKMELMTQLRKQQLRIVHFENMVDQLSKQPREKQVEIEQLQYELNAGKRRTEAEVSSLRQRINDLELQVIEARKEADEYYRANVERNNEVTALANQLSLTKIDLAKSNPTINFGAQELLIQQLQDELIRVRRQFSSVRDDRKLSNSILTNPLENAVMTSSDVDHLRTQLLKAVRRVAQLSKEKQVLIELGNRLRAQLIHHGIKLPSPSSRRQPVAEPIQTFQDKESTFPQRSLLNQNFQNKMKELEQLQYDLTKQELTQKRKSRLRRASVGSTDESRNIQSSESDVDRPRSILKSSRSANQSAWSADESPVQLRASMSTTGGGDSLREIWAMMDDGGPSPQLTSRSPRLIRGLNSSRSPNRTQLEAASNARPKSANSLTVRGSRPSIRAKTTLKKSLSPRAAGKALGVVTAAAARKSKVRNYNLKYDLPSTRQ